MNKYLKKNKTRTRTNTRNKKRTNTRKNNRTNTRKNNRTNTRKNNRTNTRKNKTRGGGKSKQQIIDELKEKGKYEEWVNLGGYFGLTSDTLNIDTFKIRPFKYYNVDSEIVNVSMIEPNYRPDLDNIAVFKQFHEEDPSSVGVGKYKIVNSNEPLTTTGLATCTGLTMIIGDKKFMAHLDATTPVSSMIDKIRQVIREENVNPKDLEPHIYTGNLESELTLQKAKDLCSAIGIPEEKFTISSVCMIDIVEAPEKNISKKRQFDNNEYKEDQDGVKFSKFNQYDDYDDDYDDEPYYR
jgi:hypothetical protein